MKKYEVIFTMENEDGPLRVSTRNDGFSSIELIALLEMKKTDILAQICPDADFKRVFVDENGAEKEIKEAE